MPDVLLGVPLEESLPGWRALRSVMARRIAEGFTRDEWAYLLAFLDEEHLRQPIASLRAPWHYRPRGAIAVWLPGNVSLLGPLTLILLSLSGSELWLKAASGDAGLTERFLDFARSALPEGALRSYLCERVQVERLDRAHARHAEIAARAAVRVVFGSDAAARAIHALPHPLHSVGFSFSDKRSEAWARFELLDDAALRTLAAVFAIYGQAGCTSPRRLLLLDGTREQALEIRARLAALWPLAPVHAALASENAMAQQWGAALGWDALRLAQGRAVLAVGEPALPLPDATLFLGIVAAPLKDAIASLPPNIQTVGHVLEPGFDAAALLARTAVKRFVPLACMHHFGAIWDGEDLFRGLFEQLEVQR